MALSVKSINKIKKAIKDGNHTIDAIREVTNIVALRKHLSDLCNDGVIYMKAQTYYLPIPKKVIVAPAKAKLKPRKVVEPINEDTAKARLDSLFSLINDIDRGENALKELGNLCVDVLDNFVLPRDKTFWLLRTCANWVKKGHTLNGVYITNAYMALSEYLPHIVKLMELRDEGIVGKPRMWAVDYRDDAGENHSMKTEAVSPSVAIATVRKLAKRGFHLENCSEAL